MFRKSLFFATFSIWVLCKADYVFIITSVLVTQSYLTKNAFFSFLLIYKRLLQYLSNKAMKVQQTIYLIFVLIFLLGRFLKILYFFH